MGLALDLGLDADFDASDGRVVDNLVVEEEGAHGEDGPVGGRAVAAGAEGWPEDTPAKIASSSINSRVRAALTPAWVTISRAPSKSVVL